MFANAFFEYVTFYGFKLPSRKTIHFITLIVGKLAFDITAFTHIDGVLKTHFTFSQFWYPTSTHTMSRKRKSSRLFSCQVVLANKMVKVEGRQCNNVWKLCFFMDGWMGLLKCEVFVKPIFCILHLVWCESTQNHYLFLSRCSFVQDM